MFPYFCCSLDFVDNCTFTNQINALLISLLGIFRHMFFSRYVFTNCWGNPVECWVSACDGRSIPSRGNATNTPSRFILNKPGLRIESYGVFWPRCKMCEPLNYNHCCNVLSCLYNFMFLCILFLCFLC